MSVQSGCSADARTRIRLAENIGADAPFFGARIAWAGSNGKCKKVAPTFAHLFGIAEATYIVGASGQALTDAVRVFMCDDSIVEVTVQLIGTGIVNIEHQRDVQTAPANFQKEIAIGLLYHHHRNFDIGGRWLGGTQSGSTFFKIADDATDRACILGIEGFVRIGAYLAVNKGNFTRHIVRRGLQPSVGCAEPSLAITTSPVTGVFETNLPQPSVAEAKYFLLHPVAGR